jgi:hypothetical protein
MFVSSDIADALDTSSERMVSNDHAELSIDSKVISLQMTALEIIDGGYQICLLDKEAVKRFTLHLLTGALINVRIADKQFNSQVVKLESDRCYLRAMR